MKLIIRLFLLPPVLKWLVNEANEALVNQYSYVIIFFGGLFFSVLFLVWG